MVCARLRLLFAAALLALSGCAIVGPEISAPVTIKRAAAPEPDPVVSPDVRQAYQAALSAIRAGQYKEAEGLLLRVSTREPGLSGPVANLAMVYDRTSRAPLAIKTMRRAIDLNPRRADYHNVLGVMHRQQGEFKEARQAYEQSLAMDPGYAPAQLNLGILWDIYLQEPDKALAYYQRYQQLVPGDTAMITKWVADIQQRTRAAERKPKQEVKG